MILSHMAPSCVNMSSCPAIWTHFRPISMTVEQIKIPTFIYLNFIFPENRSLFVGRPFFRKLFASKNDAEPYRRNLLGPNFQKHLLFHFRDLWFLILRSWYQDLGTKILVPGSWYQDPGTARHGNIWHGTDPGTARHGNIWHGTDHKGTARKYLARHGSTRSGHGTARDVPVFWITFYFCYPFLGSGGV